MENQKKEILFNPINSLYGSVFKFHKVDEYLFMSLKAEEETIGYTQKLFPGDDRDQIISYRNKEMYFLITDDALREKLNTIVNARFTIIFVYEDTDKINTYKLIDFYFLRDQKDKKRSDFKEFPFKAKIGQEFESMWREILKGTDFEDMY